MPLYTKIVKVDLHINDLETSRTFQGTIRIKTDDMYQLQQDRLGETIGSAVKQLYAENRKVVFSEFVNVLGEILNDSEIEVVLPSDVYSIDCPATHPEDTRVHHRKLTVNV